MHKEVIVRVKGTQGPSEDDVIEMIALGQYFDKAGKTYIKYEDNALDEDHPTPTTVKIDGRRITILRHGGANTQMVFEEGRAHSAPYETPFGLFEITTRTNTIEIEATPDRLWVKVAYEIDISHAGSNQAEFVMEVKNRG